MATHRKELLVTNLGTPSAPTPEAVRAFLAEFLGDPCVVHWPRALWLPILHGIVLRRRPRKVAELYREIWTPDGSPLEVGTRRIAEALQALVARDVVVTPAYRYGSPSLEETLARAQERAEEVVVLPLYPQRTASTTGSIERAVAAAAARLGTPAPPVVAPEPDDPDLIAALVDRARESAVNRAEYVLISCHGIPESVDRAEGGQYSGDCERTELALMAGLGRTESSAGLCYQSRFGPGRWLGPATADLLRLLPRRGVRSIGVIAPGFPTDCLETLEELGVRGREDFRRAGGIDFRLAPGVGDHPRFLRALLRLAGEAEESAPR